MHVAIVGAGPAGSATALLLARNGVEVTLLDRESDFGRVFRGEGLMPSGVDALLQMGLGGLLAKLPERKLESWELYLDGEHTFSVPEPIEELGERAVRVVPQPLFLEALVAEAAQHPSFRFERGAIVRDLLREHGRVAGLRLDGAGGPGELHADYVLGCDGRASAVRKRAELELTRSSEHYDVLWFKLPAPARLREGCSMLLMASGRSASACYTSWDGRLQYAWTLPKGGYRDVKDTDWAVEIGRTAPDWLAEHLVAVRDEIEGPVLLDVIVGRCPSWSAPGVLLIGDAAHPMSPIRAQGINVALRDAIVTANRFVPLARDGAGPTALDAAARAVQAEREPEIVRAQTLQLRDARGLGSWWMPPVIGLAKRVGRRLGRHEWARNAWLAQQHDLRFGSTEVRLEV